MWRMGTASIIMWSSLIVALFVGLGIVTYLVSGTLLADGFRFLDIHTSVTMFARLVFVAVCELFFLVISRFSLTLNPIH